jgi:hypothetical protein
VVLRPPPEDDDSSRGWHHIIFATLLVVFNAAFFPPNILRDGPQQHARVFGVLALLGCCVTYPLYLLSMRIRRRQSFVEGSIEITQSCVQLVSTYGALQSNSSSFSPSPASSMSPLFSNAKQHQQQFQQKPRRRRRPSIVTIKKNEHNCNDDVVSDIVLQQQHHSHKVIHAQIPLCQIIDVIVMEIVWPHCVWSQVAFRVRKTVKKTPTNDDTDYLSNTNLGSIRSDNCGLKPVVKKDVGQTSSSSAAGSKTNKSDNRCDANTRRHSSPSESPSAAVATTAQQLLHKGEVSIVPAFSPKDCYGMLSYEECLLVQVEIEQLLGI